MPGEKLVRDEARRSGCFVDTGPEDGGPTKFRFFTRPCPDGSDPSYSAGPIGPGKGVFDAFGADEAMVFLAGFNAGKYADTITVARD